MFALRGEAQAEKNEKEMYPRVPKEGEKDHRWLILSHAQLKDELPLFAK